VDCFKVLLNSPGGTEELHINLRCNSNLTRPRLDSVPPECDAGENLHRSGRNRGKGEVM
jgi:hypothetical protein